MVQLVSQAAPRRVSSAAGERGRAATTPHLAAHCSCVSVFWNKSNITPSHPGRAQRPLASLSAPQITRRVPCNQPPLERLPCALPSKASDGDRYLAR
jgi:hypothetical protein